MESPGLFEAYMEAEARYRTTTGAEQQHWFDRRVEIAAALNARFGWWPEPKRSAEDPAARPFQIPDADEIKAASEAELDREFEKAARRDLPRFVSAPATSRTAH
jgi:hypothetical protein